jgi:hypothetical protein
VLSGLDAARWCERAVALAVLLQTVELLQLRRSLADDGIWRWPLLRREHAAFPAPLRWLFALLLPYRPFLGLLWLRLAAALALLAFSRSELLVFLALGQVAIGVRFRGSFNGGSDSMTVLILFGLSLAASTRPELLGTKAGLAYIAVQLTLSYFIAGVAKLKEAAWRDGSALAGFLSGSAYATPGWAQRLAAPALRRPLAWSVIGFECGFPLAWLDPRVCLLLMAAGAGFHVLNAYVFGLNRFLFAWLAAYPALLFCSQLAAGR